jgi:hypothetical protein
LPKSRSLVVNSNEDLGDVFVRDLVILRCRGFANVDRGKSIVSDRLRATEISVYGVLVRVVDDAPLLRSSAA